MVWLYLCFSPLLTQAGCGDAFMFCAAFPFYTWLFQKSIKCLRSQNQRSRINLKVKTAQIKLLNCTPDCRRLWKTLWHWFQFNCEILMVQCPAPNLLRSSFAFSVNRISLKLETHLMWLCHVVLKVKMAKQIPLSQLYMLLFRVRWRISLLGMTWTSRPCSMGQRSPCTKMQYMETGSTERFTIFMDFMWWGTDVW